VIGDSERFSGWPSKDEEDLGLEWTDEVVAATVLVVGGDGNEEKTADGQQARSHAHTSTL